MDHKLELAEWHRRVAEIYAEVRSNPDPEDAWRIWRSRRDGLSAGSAQSPQQPETHDRPRSTPFFAYDPSYRILVDLDDAQDSDIHGVDLGDDGLIALEPVGRTRGLACSLGGELTVFWICGYGGGIFLPFTDATSGHETPGGGRYLLDGIKGADLGESNGHLVLDFNFAYDPTWGQSSGRIHPPVPSDNHLPAAIRAGERVPTAEVEALTAVPALQRA